MFPKTIFIIMLAATSLSLAPAQQRIHVVVALCDNQTQGIAPVPARIGDGDDPATNLYWGCSDGLWKYFDKAWEWQQIESKKNQFWLTEITDEPPILEQITYQHTQTRAILTAEAWRGSEIKRATIRYFELIGDNSDTAPNLVAWIGHNSLMDFQLDPAWLKKSEKPKDVIVLSCLSHAYHSGLSEHINVRPVLMTDSLMYPGSFLLKNALDGWLTGENVDQIRKRAARGYMKNQKISLNAALGIFTDL